MQKYDNLFNNQRGVEDFLGMPNNIFTSGGNVSTLIGATTLQGIFYAELLDVFFALRWAILAIIILVFIDMWTGLVDSVKVKREKFHLSRVARRSIAKFLEYLSYLIFAAFLGKAIFEPLDWCSVKIAAAIGSLAAVAIEADSILGHICAIHGVKKRFSIKLLVVNYIKRKYEKVGDAIKETLNGNEKPHA